MRQHLSQSLRHLLKAQEICQRVARDSDPTNRVEARRAKVANQTLSRVRSLLEQIGPMTPAYDKTDPDLEPEATKQPRQRAKVETKKPVKSPDSFQARIRQALEKMREQDGSEQ